MKTLSADDIAKVTDAREHPHLSTAPMTDGTGSVHGMRTTYSVELGDEWHEVASEQFDDVCAHLANAETALLSEENEKLRTECERLGLAKHGDNCWLVVLARRAMVHDSWVGTRPRLLWQVQLHARAPGGVLSPVGEGLGSTAREALEQFRQRNQPAGP